MGREDRRRPGLRHGLLAGQVRRAGRPGRSASSRRLACAPGPSGPRPNWRVPGGRRSRCGPGRPSTPALPDGCADVMHARFAYFFPPGTDAGLTEALRVLRPGGQLIAVDNDYRWGEFSALLAAGMTRPPGQVAAEVDDWWRARGATRHEVRSELRFATPRRPGRRPAYRASGRGGPRLAGSQSAGHRPDLWLCPVPRGQAAPV